MRKFLFILLIITFKSGYSQITDSFSDQNFTENPEWFGNKDLFEVNTDLTLQTKFNNVTKSAYLTTSSNYALNAKWEFDIHLKFDPSTSNQIKIYLISNESDLTSSLDGYFISIGQSGSQDAYNLYKQSGKTITKIISGALKPRANNLEVKAKILVSRDIYGEWVLKTAIDENQNFTTEGIVKDLTFIESKYFGLSCKYSSTRSNKFLFDNLLISDLYIDESAPILLSSKVINGNTIELEFNEALDETEAKKIINYTLNPSKINPSNVYIFSSTIRLSFDKEFETNNYSLKIDNIKDTKGNTIKSSLYSNFYYLKPYLAKSNDIVFNEIFPDPNPQVDLPVAEFIELWNTSKFDISLKDFTFYNGQNAFKFIGDTIKSNQYIILCAKSDTSLFTPYGKTIGISPFVVLNNKGGNLRLTNQNGQTIDEINYSEDCYKDELKKHGGYTLELMDEKSKCSKKEVFSASNSQSGGSPGEKNSIYHNNYYHEALIVSNDLLVTDSTVILKFNRAPDLLSSLNTENYFINNGLNNPIKISTVNNDDSNLILHYGQQINDNLNYTLNVSNISDCGNGYIDSQIITFFIAGKIKKNDVLISEILFNPKEGGYDFVEIYNNSNRILNLNDLSIANRNAVDSISSIYQISSLKQVLAPKSYWVLTENKANIISNYDAKNIENFNEIKKLPSFNNDKGNIVLLNSKNEIIDEFNYNEKMHFSFLNTVEGVSLERSDFSISANDNSNFKSATSSVGYATPTYQNSQFLTAIDSKENISIASETFSPDNDGFEDIFRLAYHFETNNWICNINIIDKNGLIVKRLVKNQSISNSGEWQWDGFDENNKLAKIGIYIIDISLFNDSGKIKKFKKVAVLASKF